MTDKLDDHPALRMFDALVDGAAFPWKMPDHSAHNATVERLAKRLGVKPYLGDPFVVTVRGEDHLDYSIPELVHAMLDRLDAASGGEAK